MLIDKKFIKIFPILVREEQGLGNALPNHTQNYHLEVVFTYLAIAVREEWTLVWPFPKHELIGHYTKATFRYYSP